MELQQQYIEQAINLHNNNPVVDAHLDLAAELVYRVRNGEMNPLRTYYLKNLRAAGVNLVVSSVYQSDRQLLEEGYEGALWQIHVLQEAIRADPEFMEVRTCKDLDMALATGRIGVLLYMEGLDCIGTDLDRLYQLWELGVRGASLTWSRENALAHGCCKAGERIQIPGGLTALGACAVREMEQMEMFLDVSHLNDDGFEDVDWIAQKPFLATHSNSRRVWFNYRNLRDDQMRRLAARDHIGEIGDLEQRPGAKDRLGLFHARAGDVCTTFGRQRDQLHSGESLQHLSDAGAAHGEHLRQRLFRQFAPRQQLVFDNRGHQRLKDGFVFVLQVWRGVQTVHVVH